MKRALLFVLAIAIPAIATLTPLAFTSHAEAQQPDGGVAAPGASAGELDGGGATDGGAADASVAPRGDADEVALDDVFDSAESSLPGSAPDAAASPPSGEGDDGTPGAVSDAGVSDDETAADDALELSGLRVVADAEEVFRAGGSAHIISERELERLDYDDPLSVLATVPGVYVRQEDGTGLRPNIGIRGASAERSRRVTLMEDGVLLGPAPYSAPAAYYFPLITRMVGLEVFMGPASIPYGPHTVGGAVNLLSRTIPTARRGGFDVALGTTSFGRFHAHYGDSNRSGGFVAEAVHIRSDGFRQLDFFGRDDSTGYARTDAQIRGELHGDLTNDLYHRLELTLGLGLEESNETYLGLSVADLRAQPRRRYGASSDDRMEWWRTRVMLRYELTSEHVDLDVTAYRHDFDRTWQRIDSFRDGTGLASVLANPTAGRNAVYYAVLTGEEAASTPGQALIIVRNARRFVSQGVQSAARFRLRTGPLRHIVELGARLHFDSIARNHTGLGSYIENQRLVSDGVAQSVLTDNEAQSLAFATYVAWQLRWRRLTVTPGARVEWILSDYDDALSGLDQNTTQAQLLPGIGLTYELVRDLALFAGVHQGYSPIAPGQAIGVRPELSTNYEVGARYGRPDATTRGNVAFFLSDYQNVTGECSGAGGCSAELIDRQFNGDAATILGIEASAAHTPHIGKLSFPLRASYTWTYTRFRTSFASDNPQFGSVEVGDHLPYVPQHQFSLQAGAEWKALALNAQLLYVGRMRDEASQGPLASVVATDVQAYLDAMASVAVHRNVRIYLRGENLLNVSPIVSYRPFGARTGRPLLVQLGVQAEF